MNFSQLKTDKFALVTMDDRLVVDVVKSDLIIKAKGDIVEQLHLLEPDVSDEVLHAFVRTFFDFEFDSDYDIQDGCFSITVNPIWNFLDTVDTESDDYKLLDEYARDSLKELE